MFNWHIVITKQTIHFRNVVESKNVVRYNISSPHIGKTTTPKTTDNTHEVPKINIKRNAQNYNISKTHKVNGKENQSTTISKKKTKKQKSTTKRVTTATISADTSITAPKQRQPNQAKSSVGMQNKNMREKVSCNTASNAMSTYATIHIILQQRGGGVLFVLILVCLSLLIAIIYKRYTIDTLFDDEMLM